MGKKEKKNSKTRNKPFDFILCMIVISLLGLGIVMVLSASAPLSLAEGGESYTYALKQLLFGILGLIAMFTLSKINYNIYLKFYKVIYVISVILLLLVVIPGVGVSAKGATRWIKLPIIGQFQPSELTKLGLIIFFAGYLTEHKNELHNFLKGFLIPMFLLAIPLGILYVVQNHLSATLIVGMIIAIMMLVAGTRFIYFLGTGFIGSIGVGALLISKIVKGASDSFRIGRIVSFLDPFQDPLKTGWQVIQSLYAIGSGGLFGTGLGGSKQKYLYISEPQNDFIFAIIAEELGFIGCLLIISLFAVFIWRGILIAIKSKDNFGSLLAVGITSLIGIQAMLNIAVVTSSIPNTGVSLPFISCGGTSLFILLCSVGILLNISRTASWETKTKVKKEKIEER